MQAASGHSVSVGDPQGEQTGSSGLALDLIQLAGLTAGASSAASSTAYAVDAVVKEALLFFAIMPQDGLEALGRHRPSAGAGEEVFRGFGQQAHADARAAGEACALAHTLAASESRGGSLSGGNILPAALAAGRVANHADRTAATAREGAQLCMGILEDAVQVNASALARETAKRCAEQALHSIEAAIRAEQHSRSLKEVLAHTLSAAELQARANCSNPGQQEVSAIAASSKQAPPTAPTAPPTAQALNTVRWWEDFPLGEITPEANIDCHPAQDVPQIYGSLSQHLEAAVRKCSRAGGGHAYEDDARAVCALVEWRFSKAVTLGIKEEDVLTDSGVWHLACWRGPMEEPSKLPPELRHLLRRCGSSLVLALKAAFRKPAQMQEAFCLDKAEKLPFAGTFQMPRKGVAAEEGEWEHVCDQLGWLRSGYDKGTTLNDAAAVAAAQSCMMTCNSDGQDTDDEWSIESITLQQLHALSNRSRSSKTQSKRTSFTAPAVADKPVAQGLPVEEGDDVRVILQELLGDWDRAHPDIKFPRRGFADDEALLKKVSGPASVAARASSQQVHVQSTQVPLSPCVGRPQRSFNQSGARIKQPTFNVTTPGTSLGLGVDLLDVRDNEPATVTASSPVHKLVEPPHLLQTAALAHSDDRYDEEDGDGLWFLDTDYGTTDRKLHSFGEFHVGSRGSSYLPGKLLQQRLPRTFNESMENIAQERREEYGMPRGVTGLGRGFRDRWTRAERVNADWLLSHRARTFNGSLQGDRCGSSPIQTPAGTFIATPTWSESGDVFVPRRDDPCSPLYVQATPQRWASEHCQEMSQPSAPLQSAHMYHPGFGLLGPDQAAFLGTFGGNKFEIHKTA